MVTALTVLMFNLSCCGFVVFSFSPAKHLKVGYRLPPVLFLRSVQHGFRGIPESQRIIASSVPQPDTARRLILATLSLPCMIHRLWHVVVFCSAAASTSLLQHPACCNIQRAAASNLAVEFEQSCRAFPIQIQIFQPPPPLPLPLPVPHSHPSVSHLSIAHLSLANKGKRLIRPCFRRTGMQRQIPRLAILR